MVNDGFAGSLAASAPAGGVGAGAAEPQTAPSSEPGAPRRRAARNCRERLVPGRWGRSTVWSDSPAGAGARDRHGREEACGGTPPKATAAALLYSILLRHARSAGPHGPRARGGTAAGAAGPGSGAGGTDGRRRAPRPHSSPLTCSSGPPGAREFSLSPENASSQGEPATSFLRRGGPGEKLILASGSAETAAPPERHPRRGRCRQGRQPGCRKSLL